MARRGRSRRPRIRFDCLRGPATALPAPPSPPDEPKTLRSAASRRGVQRCRIRASAGVLDMWPDTGGRIASDVGVNPVTM